MVYSIRKEFAPSGISIFTHSVESFLEGAVSSKANETHKLRHTCESLMVKALTALVRLYSLSDVGEMVLNGDLRLFY